MFLVPRQLSPSAAGFSLRVSQGTGSACRGEAGTSVCEERLQHELKLFNSLQSPWVFGQAEVFACRCGSEISTLS